MGKGKHIPSAQHDAWVLGMVARIGLPVIVAFFITKVVLGSPRVSLYMYHPVFPSWEWIGTFVVLTIVFLVFSEDMIRRLKRAGIPSLVAAPGKGSELEASRLCLPWWSAVTKDRMGLPRHRLVLGIANGNRWRVASKDSGLLIIGGPRTGKTVGLIVPNIMAWNGPVVSTSTKPEVVRDTLARRASMGKVMVWDLFGSLPKSLEPQVTRIAYPLPQGCVDFSVALRRGKALTGETVPGVDPHWRIRSGQLIAGLLHAAALTSQPTTATVMAWLQTHDLKAPASVIQTAGGDPQAIQTLGSFATTPPGELGSIFSTASGSLAAFDDPAIGRAEAVGQPMDFEGFLVGGQDSLFLICPDDMRAHAAPLILVMLADLHRAILNVSNASENGRLPLPLFICLDELCNIAPIPDLQSWVSALPGHGVSVAGVVQDLSQLRDRYGSELGRSAPTLFSTSVIFGGSQDTEHLATVEQVTGAADLAHRRANKLPIPDHLQTGDRLTVAELSGLSRHKMQVIAAHTPPKVVKAIFWPKVEPFATWGSQRQIQKGSGLFRAVMKMGDRLRLSPMTEIGPETPKIAPLSVQSGQSISTAVHKEKEKVETRPDDLGMAELSEAFREYYATPIDQLVSPPEEPHRGALPLVIPSRPSSPPKDPIELGALDSLGRTFPDPLDLEPSLAKSISPDPVGRLQPPKVGARENTLAQRCRICKRDCQPGTGLAWKDPGDIAWIVVHKTCASDA